MSRVSVCANIGAAAIKIAAKSLILLLRISRKLPVRKPYATNHDLIRARGLRRLESLGACGGYIIVLFHAVSGNSQPTYELTRFVQRRGTGEEYDAGLIRSLRLAALRARIRGVERI